MEVGYKDVVLRFIEENNHVGIALTDGREIIKATSGFANILGYRKEELEHFSLDKLFFGDAFKEIVEAIRLKEGSVFDGVELSASDGSVKLVKLYIEKLDERLNGLSVLNIVDTTKEIVFNSFYRMLSGVNRAIIKSSDLESFFSTVCNNFARTKYVDLAWVLKLDGDRAEIVAYSGISKHVEYAVKAVENSLKVGRQAPIYLSLQDGKIKIIKDVKKDDKIKPFREELLKQGFRSACYIPVKEDEAYKYSVCLYSPIPYFFDDYIMPVLLEIQEDINFFISNLNELIFKNIFYTGMQSTPDWVLVTDTEGVIVYANEAVSKISGYALNEIIGRKPSIFKSDKYDSEFYRSLWDTLLLGRVYKGIIVNKKKDGGYFQLYHTIVPVKHNGKITHFVAISKDLSREIYLEEQVRKFKYYDQLTGLLNAEGFIRESERILENIKVEGLNYGVMVIDIYDFNKINKIYGVYTADRVLVEIGKKLLSKSKFVGRLGDDEFAMLVMFEDRNKLENVIQDMLLLFKEPLTVDNQEIDVGVNIGVAVHKEGEKDGVRSLISNANTAVNTAKKMGRGTFRVFDESLNQLIQKDFETQRLIAESLEKEYFIFHLQPILKTSTCEVVEYESLVRISHPKRGLIFPGEFIEFLERSYYLSDFERYMVGKITDYIDTIKERKGLCVHVGVNLSMENLSSGRSLETLLSLKPEYIQCLRLEITERVFSDDIERAKERLISLKEKGFKVMVDDFGTGYSSLSYIHKLPVDAIKIDISFIRNMMVDERVREIVREIVRMSKTLDIETVAEGVETKEQFELLRQFGCDYVQGYYFSKPKPLGDILMMKEEELYEKCKD